MREDLPVIVRTSASAQNFWSRNRERDAVSPNGVVIPPPLLVPSGIGHALLANRAVTPYGRQQRPSFHGKPPPPPASLVNMLTESRGVQLHILRQELEHAEMQQVMKLDKKVKFLCEQLKRAWTVNHALAGELKKQAIRRTE
jgi:hypothetical protein